MEFANLEIESSEKKEAPGADIDDWKEIFARLDPKDGAEDGRICKDSILEWIDTLNFQSTVMLEASHGISRLDMVWVTTAECLVLIFVGRRYGG